MNTMPAKHLASIAAVLSTSVFVVTLFTTVTGHSILTPGMSVPGGQTAAALDGVGSNLIGWWKFDDASNLGER